MKKIITLFSFFFFMNFAAQNNFEWLKIKNYKVSTLSDSLKETSGLAFFNEKLYTINDSGNSSEIFQMDHHSGKILKTLKTDLENKDWEAITSDSLHLFIGDFGNNAGSRKDLKIYKITLDSVVRAQSSNNAQKDNQIISFFYPEQKDFATKAHHHNWDAESMVFIKGKIHLFTKEWKSKNTTHYIIDPEISENQPAQKYETYNIGYLVTDASYFDKKLYLIGYTKKTEIFLTVFHEDENGKFFNSKSQKYYLGTATSLGQIEGIAVDQEGIYLTAEEFNLKFIYQEPYFYFIPWKKMQEKNTP